MTSQTLQSATEEIMSLLATREYRQLIDRCAKSRLSASDVDAAIREYGRSRVVPRKAPIDIDAAPIEGTTTSWSVRIPLWTQEEGRSDLTVELTVTLTGEKARIELDDVRAL